MKYAVKGYDDGWFVWFGPGETDADRVADIGGSQPTRDDSCLLEDYELAKRVAREWPGKIVRILSHEESKRKASAAELREQATQLRELAQRRVQFGHIWYADRLEARADVLWPERIEDKEKRAKREEEAMELEEAFALASCREGR